MHWHWFDFTYPHHLHCTWLECIRSYIEDTSHGFFAEWWVVHSGFIDFDNLVKIIVHYLLVGGMTCLGHWDEFPMVSAQVYMVTHWTRPMVNHDVRLSIVMIHSAIILHGLSTLREYWAYAEINRRLWSMSETLKWSYIPKDWVTIDGGWWQHLFSI